MTSEERKAAFRRVLEEVFNRGNLAGADEFVASDFVDHNAPPGVSPGAASVKAKVQMIRTAFPDAHWTIEDQVAEGNRIASRFTLRGTHKGPYRGIAPTGKQITVTGMDFIRFEGDKMAEYWGQTDTLSILQQLGFNPVPGKASERA